MAKQELLLVALLPVGNDWWENCSRFRLLGKWFSVKYWLFSKQSLDHNKKIFRLAFEEQQESSSRFAVPLELCFHWALQNLTSSNWIDYFALQCTNRGWKCFRKQTMIRGPLPRCFDSVRPVVFNLFVPRPIIANHCKDSM